MKYFKLEDFDCPCCGQNHMDVATMNRIDDVRSHFGRPLYVNSGFRCVKHNAELGGAPHSQHLVGKAVDISTSNMTKDQREAYIAIVKSMFDGIGYGKTFIHSDLRGYRASWTY